MRKMQHLIKSTRYSIRINQKLLDCIDKYCLENTINDETKGKIQILTGHIYNTELVGKQRLVEGVLVSQKWLLKTFNKKRYNEILEHCEQSTIRLSQSAIARCHLAKHYKIKTDLFDENAIVFYPNITKRFEGVQDKNSIKDNQYVLDMDSYYTDSRVLIQNQFLGLIKEKYTNDMVEKFSNDLVKQNKISKDVINRHKTYFLQQHPNLYKVTKVDATGRVYNIFTYCKREFRDLIRDEFVEVDISNSHPFILGTILLKLAEGKKLEQLEHLLKLRKDKFNESILNNRNITEVNLNIFYYLQFILSTIDIDTYNNLYNNINNVDIDYNRNISNCGYSMQKRIFKGIELDSLRSEINEFEKWARLGIFYDNMFRWFETRNKGFRFKPILKDKFIGVDDSELSKYSEKQIPFEYKKIIFKKGFMYWMNGENKDIQFLKIQKIYPTVFPNITKLFQLLKKEFGKTCLHGFITAIESDLIFETINECYKRDNSNVVGSVHDAMFVKKEYKEILLPILHETTTKYLDSIPKTK